MVEPTNNIVTFSAYRRAGPDVEPEALRGKDPGGTLPPMTKESSLEGRVGLLQVLVVTFIAGLLALAAAVLTISNGTNTRVDAVQRSVGDLNREVGTVSTKVDETNTRLDRIEQKLDRILEKR